MKIALCLFKYFPFGGLQYNLRVIAEACVARGHSVRVYAGQWQGPVPPGLELVEVAPRGLTSQARQRRFARFVAAHRLAYPVGLLVGFNKMPGLDVYYAADGCQAARLENPLQRLLPRYRHLLAFERAVFDPAGRTRVMLIAEAQRAAYQRHHATADERFLLLPPGIRRDCAAVADQPARRARARAELGIDGSQRVLLAVGSGFRTKGLARTLHALHGLREPLRNRTLLLVAGQDNARPFMRLAGRLGLQARLRFLGGYADMPGLLAAGDLLVHPARAEAAGMVLLEAASAGLPVLASGACGYAHYVREHGFGRIVPEPFVQSRFAAMLETMLGAPETEREGWRNAGIRFAQRGDIHDRARRVVDFLESLAGK